MAHVLARGRVVLFHCNALVAIIVTRAAVYSAIDVLYHINYLSECTFTPSHPLPVPTASTKRERTVVTARADIGMRRFYISKKELRYFGIGIDSLARETSASIPLTHARIMVPASRCYIQMSPLEFI